MGSAGLGAVSGSGRAGYGGNGTTLMKYASQPATSGKPACGGGGAGGGIGGYDLGFCGSGFSGSGGPAGTVGEVGDNGNGGGGGGGGAPAAFTTSNVSGGTGGSGGVVLRFASGVTPASTTGSPTIYNDGTNKHYIYSGSGSITF
jgi:hypothetical protein